MATAGQLKPKIDGLKKKIETKGAALKPGLRRILKKRLRRMQRTRRKSLAAEARREKQAAKKTAEAKPEAAAGA